jgi:broad specificity phosphatase PhoE
MFKNCYTKSKFQKNIIIRKLAIIIFLIILYIINREIKKYERTSNDNEKDSNPYYSTNLKEKLLFMRHGQTYFNADIDRSFRKINPIHIDCTLNEKGTEQAISKQELLNTLTFEKVYVSPLYRTLQTLTYSLSTHPNKDNIIATVHPLVSEETNSINDYLLDIKRNKRDFNMNSIIKIDWSLFDEYVKGIKYDENFFYFDNFDCFDEEKKNETYKILKEIYDKGDLEELNNGLSGLASLRFRSKRRFESLRHLQGRFQRFKDFIIEKHKNTLNDKEKKIFVVSHRSFMTSGTNMTPYESEIH